MKKKTTQSSKLWTLPSLTTRLNQMKITIGGNKVLTLYVNRVKFPILPISEWIKSWLGLMKKVNRSLKNVMK